MKNLSGIIILLLSFSQAYSTTWFPAFPYKQTYEGQKINIEATPFEPFMGSPQMGETKVYLGKKLLYSLDKYFREPLFTSEDGQYLIIVHTSNSQGIASFTTFGFETINFNETAIEVYKNGQNFKKFTLRDVIDTTRIFNNGIFFSWGYHIDYESFGKAKRGCEACIEVYGKRLLKNCDTNEIEPNECLECRQQCDSAKMFEIENKIADNPTFVKENKLYILTSQGFVVILDLETLSITKTSFENIIPSKAEFDPPKADRRYKKVKYPYKFLLPLLKDGRTMEEALCSFLEIKKCEYDSDSALINLYFWGLLINDKGGCEFVYVSPRTKQTVSEDFPYSQNIDEALKLKIENWIKMQIFDVCTIPKGFPKYKYSGFVYL